MFVHGDPVAVAKGLRDFAKAHPLLVVKAGYFDGKPLTAAEVGKLADLESREVLLAKAAGAMKAVTRAGLRVPEDIAIIGFDDSYISRVVEPELTTVRIDAAKMGCLAMQTLFDLIAGMPVEKTHIQNPTELIVRGTA